MTYIFGEEARSVMELARQPCSQWIQAVFKKRVILNGPTAK